VAVVGLGASGRSVLRYLWARGLVATAFDERLDPQAVAQDPELKAWQAQGLNLRLGSQALAELVRFGTIFVTPGMPKHHPALREARARGAYLTGEVPYALTVAPRPVVGITGSSGKTTTTLLTAAILRAQGWEIFAGGNLGPPALEGFSHPQARWWVWELSSFQLELCQVSPRVAALLNLFPNHLDVHPSMEAYRQAKLRILAHQGYDDHKVLSLDQPVEGAREAGKGQLWSFSLTGTVAQGTMVRDGWAVYRDGQTERKLYPLQEVPLPGAHNQRNALAASLLAMLCGASPEAVRQAVRTFQGPPHRLELVHQEGGVRYVDDSIATAPDRTLAALEAVQGSVVLIAGGSDKGVDYAPLGPALRDKVRVLLTMGPTGPAIARASRQAGGPDAIPCANLAEAVARARSLARPGEVVLLSPASASFDQFPNYAARGDAFRRLVRGEEPTGESGAGRR
jgi:UDP-N-acetylmuramoylalanine--D-glutamate ligase